MSVSPMRLTRDEVVYAIDATLPPRPTVTAPTEILIETHDARGGRLRRPEDVETTIGYLQMTTSERSCGS